MRDGPAQVVIEAVTLAANRQPIGWERVTRGGYTPAERWVVTFGDGTRAFAKVGTVERVGEWLRTEHRAYRDIAGSFMPHLLGWSDTPVAALLLEDLSDASWPPPWSTDRVARTRVMLDEVAAARCPRWAPAAEEIELFTGWSDIASDPAPFLSLGLSTRAWLDAALPALIRSERPAQIAGDRLLHFDVRSDNMCFTADRTLLVDWNWIARGNPLLDVAAWLPSLATEGGPQPEEVEPDAGVFAPALAGYFCSHAPLAHIPDAPHVRDVQLEQALTSLPWAARSLGLPPPDGPRFVRIA
ncbi:MAG TPA: hypothetical protein VES36_11500 [Candidatus Limnocylindrales bacterium]|nr:hypothetical protein [Candidatus Limnocylindrales bacterium]